VTCYISRWFTRPQTVTHPSSNRGQCRLTTLIKADARACFLYVVCEGYNCYREWCGMKRAKTFDDLVELPPHVVTKFRHLYRSVFSVLYHIILSIYKNHYLLSVLFCYGEIVNLVRTGYRETGVMDFALKSINRFLMKLFKTSNTEIVWESEQFSKLRTTEYSVGQAL